MAKEEKLKPIENLDKEIQTMFETIDGQRGFIVQEMLKYSREKHPGKMPSLEDKAFFGAVNSLLNADPNSEENKGKPVISFKATEIGIAEKIASFKKRGAPDEAFVKLEAELVNARKNLDSLDDQAIHKLVTQRATSEVIKSTKNFYVTENGQSRSMSFEENKNYESILNSNLQPFSSDVTSIMLDDSKTREQKIILSQVQKRAFECFSTDGVVNNYNQAQLDTKKLNNKEALAKFNDLVKSDLQQDNLPKLLLSEALSKNFVDKEKEVDPETKKHFAKISDKLVQSLGTKYVTDNFNKILEETSKQVEKNKTFGSRFSSTLKIPASSVDKIAEKVTAQHEENMLKTAPVEAKIEQKTVKNTEEKSVTTSSKSFFSRIASIFQKSNNVVPRPPDSPRFTNLTQEQRVQLTKDIVTPKPPPGPVPETALRKPVVLAQDEKVDVVQGSKTPKPPPGSVPETALRKPAVLAQDEKVDVAQGSHAPKPPPGPVPETALRKPAVLAQDEKVDVAQGSKTPKPPPGPVPETALRKPAVLAQDEKVDVAQGSKTPKPPPEPVPETALRKPATLVQQEKAHAVDTKAGTVKSEVVDTTQSQNLSKPKPRAPQGPSPQRAAQGQTTAPVPRAPQGSSPQRAAAQAQASAVPPPAPPSEPAPDNAIRKPARPIHPPPARGIMPKPIAPPPPGLPPRRDSLESFKAKSTIATGPSTVLNHARKPAENERGGRG